MPVPINTVGPAMQGVAPEDRDTAAKVILKGAVAAIVVFIAVIAIKLGLNLQPNTTASNISLYGAYAAFVLIFGWATLRITQLVRKGAKEGYVMGRQGPGYQPTQEQAAAHRKFARNVFIFRVAIFIAIVALMILFLILRYIGHP